MRIYNLAGYSMIALHVLASGVAAPPEWGFVRGAGGGLLYLLFVWFVGGLYLSNVMHMGIAHRALDYRPGFLTFITLFANTAVVYVDPTAWVNRHRHHHAFSDHPGDPNKLDGDGFWKTLYLCLFPYECRANLATDPVLKTWPFRLVSTSSFAAVSHVSSYGLLWLVVRDWLYALILWTGVRACALWVNMVQNYWTHDRRFGTRRYHDDHDNAMNLGDWLPVTASFGASLQNNHHHFPNFWRTSHDPGEFDFGSLTVRALQALGLVKPTASGARTPEGVAVG